jgi:hypothetical protein
MADTAPLAGRDPATRHLSAATLANAKRLFTESWELHDSWSVARLRSPRGVTEIGMDGATGVSAPEIVRVAPAHRPFRP